MMAEPMAAEQQPDLSALHSPPLPQKRKRAAGDSSPESRRSKRGSAPAANMSSDATTQAYVDSAVDAAQAAAAAVAATNAAHNVDVGDFSALQQATVDHSDTSDPANASSTAAAALGNLGSMYPTMPTIHVPQPTEETFAAQTRAEDEAQQEDTSFGAADVAQPDSLPGVDTPTSSVAAANGVRQDQGFQAGGSKPAVGSKEWHKMRKDNHKEVERRRRETINEGINELAKIVPNCEKNKGSILQRAVQFIQQLKDNEAQNIEKWTLEKLLTEQAISELDNSNDRLKQECDRLHRELDTWKRVAQNAGLQPPQQNEESSVPS